ncbi:MAG TPA: alginate lyase family protein [Pyrinomonadaceae bacterium]|nr:alginate lyase family protein [Pyrinomonadaceae bacterium]
MGHLVLFFALIFIGCCPPAVSQKAFDVAAFDKARVLKAANEYLKEAPITITASKSPRSAGGVHDFFSEGDYWWPDPNNPDGPYIQRDGMTNPDNFTDHRRCLMRLSVQVPALAAAWKITRDRRYAQHAARHLRAWFMDEQTRMNPSLQYAQAIKGRVTGRGIGIIDTEMKSCWLTVVPVLRRCSCRIKLLRTVVFRKNSGAQSRTGIRCSTLMRWPPSANCFRLPKTICGSSRLRTGAASASVVGELMRRVTIQESHEITLTNFRAASCDSWIVFGST